MWFGVPAASVTAAASNTGIFQNKIPLLMFGQKQSEVGFAVELTDVAIKHGPALDPIFMSIFSLTPSEGEDLGPCFIALNCANDPPTLYAQIQTGTAATVENYNMYIPAINIWNWSDPGAAGVETPEPGDGRSGEGWGPYIADPPVDQSFAYASPESVLVDSSAPVAADQWHHVLLSFDLTSAISAEQVAFGNPTPTGSTADYVTGAWKAYLAVDDTNYTGSNLSGTNWKDGGGANDLVTDMAQNVAFLAHNLYFYDWETPNATYDVAGATIPDGPVALPGSSDYVDSVRKVRVADLQIFTGVSLDFSVEANRRAFITSDLRPASPALAAALLGKSPEVLFQTTTDWITGNNRGTAGAFTPTGTINSFSPGP